VETEAFWFGFSACGNGKFSEGSEFCVGEEGTWTCHVVGFQCDFKDRRGLIAQEKEVSCFGVDGYVTKIAECIA
jgi:hypothetical protein